METATAHETRHGLLVAIVAAAVYLTSLGNGLVWDDVFIISQNPALHGSPLALLGGIDICTSTDLYPYYRPFTYLTFLIEQRLHGVVPSYLHLINLLLHAGNAWLVFRLARVVPGNVPTALLAGLLFAVHPLQGEAVNFISGGRNTLLACFFALAAWLCHERSVRRQQFAFALAGAMCSATAFLAKETALGLLPFVLLLEWPGLTAGDHAAQRKAIGRLVPYAVTTVVYLLLRSSALTDAGVEIDILPGLGDRLLANGYIIPRYLLSIFWPPMLSAKYPVPADLTPLVLPLAGAWLVILATLAWLLTRGRSRATLFGLAWLFVFWLPISGIVPFPSAPMADRYLYLPAIGLWLVVADQTTHLLPTGSPRRRYGAFAAGLLLLILAIQTTTRNRFWRNDITLFSHYVTQYPNEAFGYHNLGTAYLDQKKDYARAEAALTRALALDPAFPKVRTQLGFIRLKQGDYTEALVLYTAALEQNPADGEALYNRGKTLENLGRYAEAIEEYRRFLAAPGTELAWAKPQAEERISALTRYVQQQPHR